MSSSSSKYVKEMVLVPKQQGGQTGWSAPPPIPAPIAGGGGGGLPKGLYWQRQMLLDKLNNAPVVDKAIEILQKNERLRR